MFYVIHTIIGMILDTYKQDGSTQKEILKNSSS